MLSVLLASYSNAINWNYVFLLSEQPHTRFGSVTNVTLFNIPWLHVYIAIHHLYKTEWDR